MPKTGFKGKRSLSIKRSVYLMLAIFFAGVSALPIFSSSVLALGGPTNFQGSSRFLTPFNDQYLRFNFSWAPVNGAVGYGINYIDDAGNRQKVWLSEYDYDGDVIRSTPAGIPDHMTTDDLITTTTSAEVTQLWGVSTPTNFENLEDASFNFEVWYVDANDFDTRGWSATTGVYSGTTTLSTPLVFDASAQASTPLNLQVTQTVQQAGQWNEIFNVVANWDKPSLAGGTLIDEYVCQMRPSGGTWSPARTVYPSLLACSMDNNAGQYIDSNGQAASFQRDQTYEVRIAAVNTFNGGTVSSNYASTSFVYGQPQTPESPETPVTPEAPGGSNGGDNQPPSLDWSTLTDSLPGQVLTVQSSDKVILNGSRGAVEVTSGGILRGAGTADSLSVAANGVVAPGNSPGTLTVLTTLDLTGVYQAEIQSAQVYDQLRVGEDYAGAGNAVTLQSGATLEASLYAGWSINEGEEFVIIDNRSSTAVSGVFQGLAEGAELVIAGANGVLVPFTISYVGGDGNDVVLSAATTALDVAAPNTGVLSIAKKNPLITMILGLASAFLMVFIAYKDKVPSARKR